MQGLEEALREHLATLSRRLGEEQVNQNRCRQSAATVAAEAQQLHAEVDGLQRDLDAERESLHERRGEAAATRPDAAACILEIGRRKVQIVALGEELATICAKVDQRVAKVLETHRRKVEQDERERQDAHASTLTVIAASLQNVAVEEARIIHARDLFADEAKWQRARGAGVQLVAAAEGIWQAKRSEARQAEERRHLASLADVREARRAEARKRLEQLLAESAAARHRAAQEHEEEEEELQEEIEELRDSVARNRKRVERALKDAAAHEVSIREAERQSVRDATRETTWQHAPAAGVALEQSASNILPQSFPKPMRSKPTELHAEFPIVGALQALDQDFTKFASKHPSRLRVASLPALGVRGH